MAVSFDRARLAPLKDTVAVVGVGETDYGKDYRGAGGQTVSKGEARYDSYTLASRALKRALDDAGLKKDDIDGVCVGGTLSGERASEQWGLNPRWSGGGDAAQCLGRGAEQDGIDHGLIVEVDLGGGAGKVKTTWK